jgi:hypothetical protein
MHALLDTPVEPWVVTIFYMMVGAGLVQLGMWAQRALDRRFKR